MKIITEKINSEPKHSITKKDVQAIIEVVPDDWIGIAHVFSISSQLFENSNWDRPVIQNNTNFKILSRGIDRTMIIKEILIELAIRPTKTYPPKGHSLTKSQRKKLEALILPYYNKLNQ
ncbi:MAG: hypothetical protein COA50_03180 [Flavobacteriaceae bacterium]|nr:MAG: hypothetical protein COA50_03180 [Flavobacteriaceae bacterium]